MRKTLVTLLLLVLAALATAQEAVDTTFSMKIGDTLVWQPFSNCKMHDYKGKGQKITNFKPIHFGEKIEIVAIKAGKGSIIATCQDNNSQSVANIIVGEPNETAVATEKPVKPSTIPFDGTYSFSLPKDHFFITIHDEGSNFNETYMKLGDDEAYNDGQGIDRFWNVKTGKNWTYRPDAQGWTTEVDGEFEAFGNRLGQLNAFDDEVNKENLSDYYVGTEKVLDIDCWHFFVDEEDGSLIQYWVDPANGCTLKRQINAEPAKTVTVYDLNYTKLYFGPSFKKSLHDTTR